MQEDILRFRDAVEKFGRIPDTDWELILPHLEHKALDKGEQFSREGSRAHEIGYVLSGSLRQYYTKDGEEKTTYFFFDNHLICSYVSCLTGAPSLITIEAMSPVTYLSLPYSTLEQLYEQSMAWQKFGRKIAEYVSIGLEERMVSLLTRKPEERYLDLLQSNKHRILEQVPQQYIASYLGITPVSMSRIRTRFYRK